MKSLKLIISLFVIGAVIGFIAYSTSLKTTNAVDAVAYNNAVVEEQNLLTQKFLVFNTKLSTDTLTEEEVIEEHGKLFEGAQVALVNIENLDIPKGSEEFTQAAKDLVNFYIDILDDEYREIINVAYSDEVTLADADEMEVIVTTITEEENELLQKFVYEQQQFAEQSGFELQEV
ncbi:hypothetical protein KC669_01665 [Candidatus Dojkabacteria bacterium]|uniref:Uncharacterized protein n=1 Tax=Candidatus Dojkabacteria bacterium TaxID=2099670 RepID=A0A955L9T5_9BACT|nr:hypothetical protein [Candidatus Dojkabacteria bacterium]